MTQNASSESVLTLAEVAAYLKVTERTIYRLAGAKKIPTFKVGGAGVSVKPTLTTGSILSKSLDTEGLNS